jgi:hypothetical protein
MFAGFDIQILWGSMFFGTLGLLMIFGVFVLITSIWSLIIYLTEQGPVSLQSFAWPAAFLGLGFLITIFLVPSMIVTPRVVIDVPTNGRLIEYQQNIDTVEIVTPPPRVQTLQGFVPLGTE